MIIQPIVLAGGKGTRMGTDLPKVLVPLGDSPLISYVLETLTQTSLLQPIVVVGFKHELVREILRDSVLYAHQHEQLGTGHAVGCALPQTEAESILVLYGDMPFISSADIQTLLEIHQHEQPVITMGTVVVEDFSGVCKGFERYGRIVRDNGILHGIIEYKDATEEERAITEVNPSYFVINTSWLKDNIARLQANNAAGEYYLTDIIKIAIDDKQKVSTCEIDQVSALGANTPEELAILEDVLKQKRP